jgi:hypothetical protein
MTLYGGLARGTQAKCSRKNVRFVLNFIHGLPLDHGNWGGSRHPRRDRLQAEKTGGPVLGSAVAKQAILPYKNTRVEKGYFSKPSDGRTGILGRDRAIFERS